jgi:hypothetical protein
MDGLDPDRRDVSRRRVICVTLLFYVALIAGLAGLGYALDLDVWVVISGAGGSFIGFLLLQTAPVRRWVRHASEGRWGSGQPGSDGS